MRSTWIVCGLLAACGPTTAAVDGAPGGAADASPWIDASFTDGGECTDVVDLVFVLDTSSSMGFVLSELEDQIAGVVTAANQVAPDAHFGLIAFQDNHHLDTTGPLGGGVVHTAAATLQSAFATYRTTYTNNNRNPGDGPTGATTQNPLCEENSLDALYAAAVDFPWRPNATRVIIVATDDTFLEAPDNYGDRDDDGDTTSADYPREGNYPAAHSLAETVSALRAGQIRVFSFTRLTQPGVFDRYGTPRRFDWPHITDGWTTPYLGAMPIPTMTDARNFDLAQVQSGALSLAATINEVVVGSYCVPPIL